MAPIGQSTLCLIEFKLDINVIKALDAAHLAHDGLEQDGMIL
jgi:hypothetical protein